ncbi:hypothetical protein S83_035452, partial [Arachis hypogaea]
GGDGVVDVDDAIDVDAHRMKHAAGEDNANEDEDIVEEDDPNGEDDATATREDDGEDSVKGHGDDDADRGNTDEDNTDGDIEGDADEEKAIVTKLPLIWLGE